MAPPKSNSRSTLVKIANLLSLVNMLKRHVAKYQMIEIQIMNLSALLNNILTKRIYILPVVCVHNMCSPHIPNALRS